MAGIQEILTLLLIIIAVIIVPRILTRGKTEPKTGKKGLHLSGRMRIGIVLSIMIPLAAALLLKPWHNNLTGFVSVGVAPVAAGWAVFWIVSGFKRPDSH